MPPPGEPVPTNHDVDALVAWLEGSLDRASSEIAPGHIALHRLNRAEYANAI
jgi:hypothetical protein